MSPCLPFLLHRSAPDPRQSRRLRQRIARQNRKSGHDPRSCRHVGLPKRRRLILRNFWRRDPDRGSSKARARGRRQAARSSSKLSTVSRRVEVLRNVEFQHSRKGDVSGMRGVPATKRKWMPAAIVKAPPHTCWRETVCAAAAALRSRDRLRTRHTSQAPFARYRRRVL